MITVGYVPFKGSRTRIAGNYMSLTFSYMPITGNYPPVTCSYLLQVITARTCIWNLCFSTFSSKADQTRINFTQQKSPSHWRGKDGGCERHAFASVGGCSDFTLILSICEPQSCEKAPRWGLWSFWSVKINGGDAYYLVAVISVFSLTVFLLLLGKLLDVSSSPTPSPVARIFLLPMLTPLQVRQW